MDFISDILLIAGSFGLAFYCLVLSRRLKMLARSDAGLGATIATLSERVDELTQTATRATEQAEAAATRLRALNDEAERREGELAFMLAGLEGIEAAQAPDPPPEPAPPPSPIFAHRGMGALR